MATAVRIGIIGDYQPASFSHRATESALQHAAAHLGLSLEAVWLPTASLDSEPDASLRGYDGLWCAPGSPYESMTGALVGIRFARENGWPLLGT